jgi:hypothetical protein
MALNIRRLPASGKSIRFPRPPLFLAPHFIASREVLLANRRNSGQHLTS